VLVFDGQKEDLFETLGQWDRDLTRASRQDFAKLLVAGRVDRRPARQPSEVDRFAKERKFRGFLETSARRTWAARSSSRPSSPASTGRASLPHDGGALQAAQEEIIRLKDEAGC